MDKQKQAERKLNEMLLGTILMQMKYSIDNIKDEKVKEELVEYIKLIFIQ